MEETAQKGLGANLISFWKGLSNTRKIGIIILAATLVTAIILFVQYFTTPRMGVLFSGLNNDSAAAVMARLDEMGVAYELDNGGREIMVTEDLVDELRITLTSDGSLYGNSVGFELFDQTSLGASESERRINYLRALQGELQRTISQIEGIEQAIVHLVIPEPSLFIRETVPATASVLVKLNPLRQLQADQINGIVYLVAGSVENLAPENVTVIDTRGRILSDAESNAGMPGEQTAAVTLDQLEIKRMFEKELEGRIQGMLEKVIGSGSVVAMVTAELDFDSTETTEIIYGEPVLRSRSRTEEEYAGSGSIPGGETGSDSNIPSYPSVDAGTGENSYNRLDEIENYELSETEVHSIQAPGEVKKISASVIYDNSSGTLTQKQMNDIETLVASALGLSESRGDNISVAAIDFDTTYLEESLLAMEEAAQAEKMKTYIQYGLMALGLVLGLIILRMIAGYVQNYQEKRRVPVPEMGVSGNWAEKPAHNFKLRDEEHSNARKIKELTQKNPETAAALIKMWLAEDQR